MNNAEKLTKNSDELFGHPKGLYLLFASEMWERFSYYGMRAILALYLTKALLYDKDVASNLYGGYVGLIYLTPLIGGYIADVYWGNRRSIITGGLMMAMGQFTLFASAIMRGSEQSTFLMFLGLGLMIVGNGFFKPNISSMVGTLYPPTDGRKDAAYTIFYLGINLGSVFGNGISSLLGDTGDPADFKWGFMACGIAMALGTLVFYLGKNKLLISWDKKEIGITPPNSPGVRQVYFWLPVLLLFALGTLWVDAFKMNIVFPILVLSAFLITYIVFSDKSLTTNDKKKVAVIFTVSFFIIFFWATFEQAPAALTFFADEQTDRDLWGWTVPASLFQNLNGLYIVIFSLPLALFWVRLAAFKLEPNSLYKMAIGLLLITLGYILIAFGVMDITPTTKISMFYLIALYFLHSIGELCMSPIGLSLVNKLSPPKFVSLMMAVWFLAPAIANKAAGMISALYPSPDKPTSFLGIPITNLHEFFLINVGLSGVAAVLLFMIAGRVNKIMQEGMTNSK
jgi:proton-dependent oligopeptide transporter, POT family